MPICLGDRNAPYRLLQVPDGSHHGPGGFFRGDSTGPGIELSCSAYAHASSPGRAVATWPTCTR